jgi:endogenous inhibitor of DNA gyrase (YacG/DUF329 family)
LAGRQATNSKKASKEGVKTDLDLIFFSLISFRNYSNPVFWDAKEVSFFPDPLYNGAMNETSARKIECPRCHKETVYAAANPFRPFCSERCRLIDLGQWAEESYRIPTQDGASVQDAPLAENEAHFDD